MNKRFLIFFLFLFATMQVFAQEVGDFVPRIFFGDFTTSGGTLQGKGLTWLREAFEEKCKEALKMNYTTIPRDEDLNKYREYNIAGDIYKVPENTDIIVDACLDFSNGVPEVLKIKLILIDGLCAFDAGLTLPRITGIEVMRLSSIQLYEQSKKVVDQYVPSNIRETFTDAVSKLKERKKKASK